MTEHHALDPRLTPARGDLAAAHLRGVVAAPRYVEATPMQVSAGVAALRRSPVGDGEMVTQLLHGEVFDVYDEHEGWAWGQAQLDGYVGYVDVAALSAPVLATTRRVGVLRTYAFAAPDVRAAPCLILSMNAKLHIEAREGGYVRAARAGWVFAEHLGPADSHARDWVAIAEQFVGAPYLWGGKESIGLDCSGLIQSALEASGVGVPRDADMQEAALGVVVDPSAPRRRGDVVFWRAHVGVMVDEGRLLHANGTHMTTVVEPLDVVVTRMNGLVGPVTSVRRAPGDV